MAPKKYYSATPCNLEDPSNYLDAKENEVLLAIYLDCPTMASFRSLLFSSPVLKAVIRDSHIPKQLNIRATKILQAALAIQSAKNFDPSIELDKAFPLSANDDNKADNGTNACNHLAYILLKMLYELEHQDGNVLPGGSERIQIEADYDKSFAELLQCEAYDNVYKPDYNDMKQCKYDFGPHELLGETPMERLNRALQLLRHAKYRFTPSKRKVVASTSWKREWKNGGIPFDRSHGPEWMGTHQVESPQPHILTVPQTDVHGVVRKHFCVGIRLNPLFDVGILASAVSRKIEMLGPEYDPQHVSPELFRDGIRRLFNLRELGISFGIVYLEVGGAIAAAEQVPADHIYNVFGFEVDEDWSHIQDICSRGDPNDLVFVFIGEIDEDRSNLDFETDPPHRCQSSSHPTFPVSTSKMV